jgi:thiamine-phosphate pyrophosphorylase
MRERFTLGLYVLTDERLSRGRSTVDVVAAAIRGGADAIQLRAKELTAREQLDLGRALRRITRDAGVLFIVNDRADIAVAVDADGVHVGPDDLPPDAARAVVGPERIVGVSAGTVAEALAARDAGADYLGVGAIFGTTTKLDAGAPVGPARIAEIRRRVELPIVGIGGIDAGNVAAVIAAGADGAAVVSAVVAADDVEAAARDLKRRIAEAGRAEHRGADEMRAADAPG